MCQIVDRTGGAGCFHDDEVDLVFLEDRLEVVSIRGSVKELVLSGFRVEKAANCVEFSEVKCENINNFESMVVVSGNVLWQLSLARHEISGMSRRFYTNGPHPLHIGLISIHKAAGLEDYNG